MTDREIILADALLGYAEYEFMYKSSERERSKMELEQAAVDRATFAHEAAMSSRLCEKLRNRCNELYGYICANGKRKREPDPEYWRLAHESYTEMNPIPKEPWLK